MVMMKNITTISITKDTRKKLEHIKLTRRESMDDLINRLLTAGGSIPKDRNALSGEQT